MTKTKIRFRHLYMGIGGVVFALLYLLTDPSLGLIEDLPFGAGVVAEFVILLKVLLYVALLHLSRRALFDYVDLQTFIRKAAETPEGAGRVVMSIGLFVVAIAVLIAAAVLA